MTKTAKGAEKPKSDEKKDSKAPAKEQPEKKSPQEEIQALKEQLQRLQAEFINFRTRSEKEHAEAHSRGKCGMADVLLPVIDNFELALKNTDNHEQFVQGMEFIHKQLIDQLSLQHIKKLETVGKLFDPKLHQAVEMVESDLPANTIVEEVVSGYSFNDQILRVAKVKVSAVKTK